MRLVKLRDANSVTIGICIVGRIMAKPVLLIVDDDSDVLRAIERDLRFKYGADYRVIGSGSPIEARDLLKQLKVRNDSVALLLADQRMPQMDGVAFLREGMEIFPDAKRPYSLLMPTQTRRSAPLMKPISTTLS